MRDRFIRLVSVVGVAFAVGTSGFVTAQVQVQLRGNVRVEKKQAPMLPVVPAAPARPAGGLQTEVEKVVKDLVKVLRPAVKKQAVVMPAQVVAMPVMNVNANANAMVQQWTMQFRPILQVEYLFVRVVCNPTKEQRIPIARAGLKALDVAAKKYVEWQNNQNQVVGGRLVERPAIPDTRQFIQEALAAAVKANLSASQAEWYRAEIEARSAEQKQAALVNLVAKLDQTLVLSPEQRDQIKESLASHWNEPWAHGFQSFNLDDQYLPMVPDLLVSNYLNDEQKKVWAGTQKITFNSNGLSFGMTINNEPLDDAFSDAEALKEETRPEPEPEPEPEPKP